LARIPTGWHPENIKAGLRMARGPITTLSEEWGFNRNAITLTLRRHDYSQKVERLIATTLDVPLHEIWPARWSKDGTPLPRSSGFDPIPTPRVRNSQNAKAA
jgi:Ner family transcriptional regulator